MRSEMVTGSSYVGEGDTLTFIEGVFFLAAFVIAVLLLWRISHGLVRLMCFVLKKPMSETMNKLTHGLTCTI
jgi:hypothetical protein